ncbi:histidine kinase dimerization/phosphoacceptor domain -containing protein [Flavitalea sp. BT771]|uniref:tetratricopeptide repeat-containing sensor histidine kinase n=1 Tax=Flavitalea sp. BT771 TaxID=3063329 RepID=UPI0026E13AE9|nr:histidine kinase dimerization/phosphoacceptor domain -containing protein [Flavitalea sp. BT771]MDO6430017.1 histidine kinase dimerization/phosphoacceptor domain -containing protein [Flavitalea sp. BT771]MDV6217856.1 histidine kinase dimerization/phosphoacceptor domain -containing protein [Flavitalea sp. BT771]
MQSLNSIFIGLLLTTGVLSARGQFTDPSINLPSFPDSVPMEEIIRRTEALPGSISKARQLLAVAQIYLEQGRSRNLDTSLGYVQEAFALSSAMRDTAGIHEALARRCLLFVLKGQIPSAEALLPMTEGVERVRLLLTIADGILSGRPVEISAVEKVSPYLARAKRLTDALGSTRWRHEYLMEQAKYFFQHGDVEKGRNAILAIINSCDSLGDKKGVGHYWLQMDSIMPYSNNATRYHFFACREAIRAYTEAGDQINALYALRSLANRHRYVAQHDSAEKEFLLFLRESEKLGITPSAYTNFRVGLVYAEGGNPARGLDYMFQALQGVGRNGDLKKRIHVAMAVIYQLTGIYAEELNYGRLLVEEGVRFQDPDRHYYTCFVVEGLIREGNPGKALVYLQQFNAADPPVSLAQKGAIAYNYGLIYDALGDYPKAAPWFQRLADLDTAGMRERDSTIYGRFGVDPWLVHVYTGRFYVHWGQYQRARPFLERALLTTLPYKGFTDGGELQLLLYKTDSATGNLRSAIDHYLLYTVIKDSLLNAQKVRQLQTLQVQYQTKEREQSIQLLKSEGERQRALFDKASLVRDIELGGIIVLLAVTSWIYYAYRSKRRNVQRLLEQQTEINDKNLALERLLEEKNELLTEKSLLLQEVHHRVKNNLHTVMSLLESQTAYLNDPAARSALLDSQNRIQTISLLHQKLYWSTNVTTLEMAPYTAELCAFLDGSLGARERRILITHSVEPIELDISVGLPIGLLLNEAITNAIKHAFPDNTDGSALRTGHVEVTMRKLPNGLLLVQIADDGIGMPAASASREPSLGLTLMKSIGQKLAGSFAIHSSAEGVSVRVEFAPAPVFVEAATSLS